MTKRTTIQAALGADYIHKSLVWRDIFNKIISHAALDLLDDSDWVKDAAGRVDAIENSLNGSS